MKDDLESGGITSSAPDVHETVAAISTPAGPGGVGMVRISEPGALGVGRSIFTPLGSLPLERHGPKKAVIGRVHYPGHPREPIDQAVYLSFVAPGSFTGEDTVEITTHGSPLIMGEVLEAATQAGARLAEPGEFTKRAFLNGRIDLTQAESVASLIFASTEEARKVMQRQVEGAMSRRAVRLREDLLEVKVLLESAIDFPDDVGDAPAGNLVAKLSAIIENVEKTLSTSSQGIAMTQGLRLVIAGAPNVGKSSLLNALLEEDRAIVHEIAGTTRDYIEGRISVRGIPLVVVDTAGIRDEAGPLEDQGIDRARNLMRNADLLLLVVDGSRPPGSGERRLLDETAGEKRVVAVNKSDLPPHPGLGDLGGAVRISALTGTGLEGLKDEIHRICAGSGPSLEETDAVVTSFRQSTALAKVLGGCSRARDALRMGADHELVAVDLEDALLAVGDLTGEVTADEVLEGIFSRFCIGK